MPLTKRKGAKARSKNISTLVREGRPLRQAIAIAYAVQRRKRKKK